MPRNNIISRARVEAASIRSKLKLRINLEGHYEVYTTIHGTGLFKWFIIDSQSVEFYKKNFPDIQTVEFNPQEYSGQEK